MTAHLLGVRRGVHGQGRSEDVLYGMSASTEGAARHTVGDVTPCGEVPIVTVDIISRGV